jgi:hypothetical protein
MSDEQVREASWVVQVITGISAYLYGIGYSQQTFMQELDAIVEHIKSQAG